MNNDEICIIWYYEFMKNNKLFIDIAIIIILTVLGIILVKTQILPRLGYR